MTSATVILIAITAGFFGGIIGAFVFAAYSVRVHRLGQHKP